MLNVWKVREHDKNEMPYDMIPSFQKELRCNGLKKQAYCKKHCSFFGINAQRQYRGMNGIWLEALGASAVVAQVTKQNHGGSLVGKTAHLNNTIQYLIRQT